MIDYGKFPGLAGVYLEDSYDLAIAESADRLTFRLDARGASHNSEREVWAGASRMVSAWGACVTSSWPIG